MTIFRQDARFFEPQPLIIAGQLYISGTNCASLSGASNLRLGGPASVQRNSIGNYSVITSTPYPIIASFFGYEHSASSTENTGSQVRIAMPIGCGMTGTSPNFSGNVTVATASFQLVTETGALADAVGSGGGFVNVLLVCNAGGPAYPR